MECFVTSLRVNHFLELTRLIISDDLTIQDCALLIATLEEGFK